MPTPSVQAIRNSAFFAKAIAAKYADLGASDKAAAKQRLITEFCLDPSRPANQLSTANRDHLMGGLLLLMAEFDIGASSREVILTFPDTLPAGTSVNIQTGVYAGGGPASIDGPSLELPPTGEAFVDEGFIIVAHNGQILNKGKILGEDEAQWVSLTEIAFDRDILSGNTIGIRL